jgi:hypothetical protein
MLKLMNAAIMILRGRALVTPAQNSDKDESENIHSAVSSEKCYEMEEKYGWQLKDIRPTFDAILKVDCVFYGEQTSFQDMWYDHQD